MVIRVMARSLGFVCEVCYFPGMGKAQIALLRELLAYDSGSGLLFWMSREARHFTDGIVSAQVKAQRFNTRHANRRAFTAVDARGYGIGGINGALYSAHRVVWAFVHGEWPTLQVDHINGNRTDNRIVNLRLVSNRHNSMNSAMKRNNTSGFPGVSWHRNRFRAQIKIHGRQKFLGYFDAPEDAHKAYCAAKAAHGFSDRHGARS